MGEEKGDKLLERFSEEAFTAGSEACAELRNVLGENPDMFATIVDTLPALIDSWAYYTMTYIEIEDDTEKLKRLLEELTSIITSLVTSVYGLKIGIPLSVLLLIPAGPLTGAIATCGHKTDEPIVEPANHYETRLRASIISAQSSVYRVYFTLTSKLEEERNHLWRPKEARILHM